MLADGSLMIDVGEFQPTSTIGPSRTASGTVLGRFTTTDEQLQEAIEHLTAAAAENKATAVRATIIWSRGEPSVIELECVIEHLNGKRVWLPGRTTEMELNGAEIRLSEEARLRRLSDELGELHEGGML